MNEALAQDGLNYVETVLDKRGNSDPQVRADAAELLNLIARIQIHHGRREEARTNFIKSLSLWERLNEEYPEISRYPTELADCYRTMSFFEPGDNGQRVAWLKRALKLHEEVRRRESDEDFVLSLNVAQCLHDLAAALQNAQRLREAEENYNRSIELMSQISGKHPQELACKNGLADSFGNLGLLYHTTGRDTMAEEAFGRADALLEMLMKEGVLTEATALSRSSVALNWGNLYLETGQIDKALASFDRGLGWCANVLRREPDLSPLRENALKLHGSKANVYGSLKRYTEAAAEWQRVVEFAEGPARLEYRLQHCLALARGGDSPAAAVEADALAAEPACSPDLLYNCACIYALSGHGDRAIALLSKLHGKGYFKEAEPLKNLRTDGDLDSLRRRNDFVKLLSDLH